MTDAQALLPLGSAPTAYSLAVLAMEEASKAIDWHQMVAESGDAPVGLSRTQHQERLRRVRRNLDYLDVFDELMQDPDGYQAEPEESWRRRIEEESSSDNAMKQRGFYVDVDGDEVLEPSLISAAQAQAMVDDAGKAIALIESLME